MGQPRLFRLHFCTLAGFRHLKVLQASLRLAGCGRRCVRRGSLVSTWGETYGGLSLVWLSDVRINLHAGASVLGRAQQRHLVQPASPHRPPRVKQQLICPLDNQVLERSDIVKGYEYRKDEYVIIDPEEIKKIEPKTAKTMEILEFVKSSEVDPVYFESSYYMVPEEAGRRPYALLTKALEESEFVAIAKLTMHNREYTVFLRPHKGGMMLHTMYYAEEVREVESFGAPDVEIKEAEIKVAHQLIEALADEWDPEKYHDTFQENLKKLIETKLEGGEVQAVEQPKKLAPVVDLMAALKESLAQTKKPAASEKVAEMPSQSQAKAKRGRA